jgi:hypothetical protein
MKARWAASTFAFRLVLLTPLLMFSLALSNAEAQDTATHGVVPLHKLSPGQAVERVWGDPDTPGEPFVIRIHADAGYIILPHTHLVDENIVVVQGVWALGMGSRFDRSALEQLDSRCVRLCAEKHGALRVVEDRNDNPGARHRAVLEQARRPGL